MKIKWKVAEKETGRWAWLHKRGWPTADYEDGSICATIRCADEYIPSQVKIGNHAELKLMIADYSKTPWVWVVAKTRYATLKEAKEGLVKVLAANRHLIKPDKIN